MIIIANDTRSRRNWINSFISIALVLRQKPPPLGRRGTSWDEMRHWKLSRELAIRSMNTSSSVGSDAFPVELLRSR